MTAGSQAPGRPPTPFARAVRGVVASLPEGTTATYGEVAAEAGRPGAARGVGSALRGSTGLPWWRVVRADGSLPKGPEQAARLRREGVPVVDGRLAAGPPTHRPATGPPRGTRP